MRALVIEKPGNAVCKKVADPVTGPGDCLLRPLVGGICSTDAHILLGDFIGHYPVIPCHELTAEVVQLGPGVSELRVGERVAVDPNIRCGICAPCRCGEINICERYEAIGVTRPGGFAELLCAPATQLYRIADSHASAAAFTEPLACVLYGQGRITWQPGMKVMIWGAGAIGLLHLQLCKKLRGATVTMVDIDSRRLNIARRLGADETLLWNHEPKPHVHLPCDVAIDASGNTAAVIEMFKYLRRGGQALIFGVYARNEYLQLSTMDIFYHDWKIVGSFTYRHEFAQAAYLISSKVVDTEPLVSMQVGLEQVPTILQKMAAGERMGKVQVLI